MTLRRRLALVALAVVLTIDFGCTRQQVSTKKREAGVVALVVALLGGLAVSACGSSATKITDVQGALTSNPDANPITLDSSNSSSSASAAVRMERSRMAYGGVSLDLRLAKAAGSGSSFGKIQGYQCKNDSQQAYFTLDITNEDGEATYVGTFKTRGTASLPHSWGNADISKSVSTDGTGTITAQIETKSLAVSFSGGTTNTLAGSNGYVFAWNNSGVACGKKSGGSNVTFSFSANSSTKEKASPAAGSDSSLCSSLPTAPTYSAPASLTGDEVWYCAAPTGSTAITGIDAADLEDKGGDDCVENTDYYASASVDTGTCGSSESVSDMACMLNALYAIAVQSEKSIKRSLECKFEGVAQMAKDGDVTGFTGKLADESKYHALDMSIGG